MVLEAVSDFVFLVPTVLRGHEPQATDEVNASQGALRPNFAVLERRAFRLWVPTQSMGTSIRRIERLGLRQAFSVSCVMPSKEASANPKQPLRLFDSPAHRLMALDDYFPEWP